MTLAGDTAPMTLASLFNLSGPELVIILVIMLLLFGRRLPEVGKSLGKGIVEFKKGIKGTDEEAEQQSMRQPVMQTGQQGYLPQQQQGYWQQQQPYPQALPQGAPQQGQWQQQQGYQQMPPQQQPMPNYGYAPYQQPPQGAPLGPPGTMPQQQQPPYGYGQPAPYPQPYPQPMPGNLNPGPTGPGGEAR